MSEERQAVYYGKVVLIPGVICDGYVAKGKSTADGFNFGEFWHDFIAKTTW